MIKFLLTHFTHPAEHQRRKPEEFPASHITLFLCSPTRKRNNKMIYKVQPKPTYQAREALKGDKGSTQACGVHALADTWSRSLGGSGRAGTHHLHHCPEQLPQRTAWLSSLPLKPEVQIGWERGQGCQTPFRKVAQHSLCVITSSCGIAVLSAPVAAGQGVQTTLGTHR